MHTQFQLLHNTPLTVIVTGANGAIGQALIKCLLMMPNVIKIYTISRTASVNTAFNENAPHKVIHCICDITNSNHLQQLNHRLYKDKVSINMVFNTVGVLHQLSEYHFNTHQAKNKLIPEKSLAQLSLESLQTSCLINAFAPILFIQSILPYIPKEVPVWVASLSARIGSITDNQLGGWYSYRAAKSAQNQLFKTLSIELNRTHKQAICLQLHPGTVDSKLSQPFQNNITKEKLFTPEYSAKQLLAVIASKSIKDTGSFWDWNNQPIPW